MVRPSTGTWNKKAWKRTPAVSGPQEWWPESHARVLRQAKSATWPETPAGVEEVTCELLGTELHDHFPGPQSHLTLGPWIYALAARAGESLGEELADDTVHGTGAGWKPLWAFLRGLVLTVPLPSLDGEPGVAREQSDRALALLHRRGIRDGWSPPRPVPAGELLVARDRYGSRFLLAASFGYWDGEEDHWYGWDIDRCHTHDSVGTGLFGSASETLAEWQDTVGPSAAGAVLRPCDPDLAGMLVASCLGVAPAFDFADDLAEPASVLREQFRAVRRAQALALTSMVNTDAEDHTWQPGWDYTDQRAAVTEEFLRWHAERHQVPDPDTRRAATSIAIWWVPMRGIDDRMLFGCSPHRVEVVARMIGPFPRTQRVLPEWTRWCAERSGLSAAETERVVSIAKARFELAQVRHPDWKRDWNDIWPPLRKAESGPSRPSPADTGLG